MASLIPASTTACAQTKFVCCLGETLHGANVHTRFVFDGHDKLAAVVEDWEFDRALSTEASESLAPRGLLPSRSAFADLARQNAVRLAKADYYTRLEIASRPVEVAGVENYWMDEGADRHVVWHMSLKIKSPEALRGALRLHVADPTNYLAFSATTRAPAAQLVDAPRGCRVEARTSLQTQSSIVGAPAYEATVQCP